MLRSYLIKNASIMSIFDGVVSKGDILVENGIVTRIGEELSAAAEETIDAQGLTITTGWVDPHAHFYYDSPGVGVDPQIYFLPEGVTYAVDPGTAGADTFADFRHYVRWCTDLKYKSFLNISRIGLPILGYELNDMDNLDKDACKAAFNKYRDELCGLKVRVTSAMCADPLAALRAIRELCDELGTTMCVHATRCDLSTETILGFMKKGDQLTHTYAKTDSGILDKGGKVKQCVLEARKRGVIFDMGHGINSFTFEVAQAAMAQGFELDTISTDLHVSDIDGPVFNMATTLSKFLCLGVSLDQAIRMITEAPVRLLGLTDKALEIKEGKPADFTAFKVEYGNFTYIDSAGTELAGDKKLQSIFTCVGSKIFTPRRSRGKNRPIGKAALDALAASK
ncbi:MAG: amidohydrolase family protein [Clostridiales bacterium]